MSAETELDSAFAAHAARLAGLTFPQALGVGERAPEFALPNARGETVTLTELLQRDAVALVFYRGAWCPYCNAQLRALQLVLPELEELGVMLVAVSPQTPDGSLATVERNGLEFEVLSDVNSYVASDYGVAFALTHEEQELFVAAGNDLARVNGHGAWLLPAPSLFVIDHTGVIRYVHVDPDYTRRIDPRELLGALRGL